MDASLRWHDEEGSPQSLQRRAQPFGFRGLGIMIRARLLNRFRLRALGEVRIGKALREVVALFLRDVGAFFEANFLGVEVDHLGYF